MAYNADGYPDTITYDTGPLAGYSLDYAQDNLGRPLGYILADGTGTLAEAVYSYDAAGRLATVADGANAFSYGYAPSVPNRIATVTANNGTANVLTTTKTYNGLDRLSEVTATGIVAGVVSSHAYQYNARNQRTRATLADDSYPSSPAGYAVTSWDYSYDDLGQVTGGVKKTAAGTPIPGMAFGFAFDATRLRPSLRSLATARQVGNRTTSTENGHQTDYAANLLNQYTERSVPGLAHVRGAASTEAIVTARPTVGGTPVATPTQSQRLGETFFVPLPVDNAAAPFLGAAEVTAVLPGAAPGGEDIVATESRDVRIPQATQALTYDLDGNLTSDGIWTYEWNAENRLARVEGGNLKAEFGYGSQGRRFRKTVSTSADGGQTWTKTSDTLYLYDNWNLIAEFSFQPSSLIPQPSTHLPLGCRPVRLPPRCRRHRRPAVFHQARSTKHHAHTLRVLRWQRQPHRLRRCRHQCEVRHLRLRPVRQHRGRRRRQPRRSEVPLQHQVP